MRMIELRKGKWQWNGIHPCMSNKVHKIMKQWSSLADLQFHVVLARDGI